MRLRDIHPEDFLRAGALLGTVSEQVDDSIRQSRSCAEVRWVGRPNQRYQERLQDLSRDLSHVRGSFDDASGALIAYANSLGIVRDLALQADLLEAQAHDLIQQRQLRAWRDNQDGTAASSLVALTPREEVLLERARLLHAEATDIAEAASRRVTALLHDLAEHAMHVSGWTGLDRGVTRAALGFSEVMTANVTLAGDAFQSLPGVGDEAARTRARKELWAAGASVLQPWLAVEDLVHQFQDQQYAHAGGELAGVLILKGHGGKKEALFGAHNALPVEVLSALRDMPHLKGLDAAESFALERAQQTFWKQIQHYKTLPAPSVSDLLRDGVNLVQQEALGGHTLLKHIGRDLDFLGKRQLAETKPGRTPSPMSSFTSQDEAELAVRRTLAFEANTDKLRAWADRSRPTPLRLSAPAESVGLVRASSGAQQTSAFAIVEFVKDAKGGIFLNSAFLEAGPEGR